MLSCVHTPPYTSSVYAHTVYPWVLNVIVFLIDYVWSIDRLLRREWDAVNRIFLEFETRGFFSNSLIYSVVNIQKTWNLDQKWMDMNSAVNSHVPYIQDRLEVVYPPLPPPPPPPCSCVLLSLSSCCQPITCSPLHTHTPLHFYIWEDFHEHNELPIPLPQPYLTPWH